MLRERTSPDISEFMRYLATHHEAADSLPSLKVLSVEQDLGLGEATPLASHPNSDMALAQFLADLHDVGETLESFANGTVAPLAVLFGGTANVTATLQGGGSVAEVTPGTTNGVGRYAISGSKYWESTESFSIAFSAPVAAFGFYGVDIGDFQGRVTLQLLDGGVVDLVIPHTVGSPGGTVIYFGFVDYEQQYTGLSFGNTAPGTDFFGFDDFTVGTLPNAIQIDAASPLFVDDPEAIRGKRVLVVEDGPTLTHGEMAYGAGYVAARRFGAKEIVDPRPFAVKSIAATYAKYPKTGPILPAMGYGEAQMKDLEATINASDVDMVVVGTPIDLTRVIKISKPYQRVRYELQEIGKPTLQDVLMKKFGKK